MIAFSATRAQVIAYRLDAQHLAKRLPAFALLEATGACGIQDTPPGSAALALHARLEGLTPQILDQALAQEKTLLQTMSLRGAPYLFPTADAPIFCTGALPENEEEMRFFIRGAASGLQVIGMTYTELVAHSRDAVRLVLDRQQMNKDRLGRAAAERIAGELSSEQAARWMQPSTIISGQFLGESLVRFAIYILGLQGLFCLAPRALSHSTEAAEFLLIEQWLGHPLLNADTDKARAELARRYLRCYGPSTVEGFAGWAGISPAQAVRGWAKIESGLLPVDFEGRRTFLFQEDLEHFRAAQPAQGIRLLPPHDPYLLLRDRTTIIPNRDVQRSIWRATGNPGALLVDGSFAGIWRAKKNNKHLDVSIQSFAPLGSSTQKAVRSEAESLLPFKACIECRVEYR